MERLRLKGLLTDAQRIILWLERRTIVIRWIEDCVRSKVSCIGGLQEETEFPETLCVCGSVRLRLWYVRRDFVARDFLEEGAVLCFFECNK